MKSSPNYMERLYVLDTYVDLLDTRLEEIDFEIQEIDFDHDLLAENPMRAVELYEERLSILAERKSVGGYTLGHYNNVRDPETGKNMKNVMCHTRISVQNDLMFIEEIQSDWAQTGRKSNWENPSVPKAPFVTNTELWAGLILRRTMQIAAESPGIKRVAWINAELRNGARFLRDDGLNEFYLKMLPKIGSRAISGTGEKIKLMNVRMDSGEEISLPGFDLTDMVREKLMEPQPLYSLDSVLGEKQNLNSAQKKALAHELKKAREMLGDSVSIRLAAKVLDVATGREVAGRSFANIIDVSLNARDPLMTLNHESWHYAHENLISPREAFAVEQAFANGSKLNQEVRLALVKNGASPDAIAQCDDSKEAAAHGFSLWAAGDLHLNFAQKHSREDQGDTSIDRTVGRLFRKVEMALFNLSQWVRRVAGEAEQEPATVERVFEKLRAGAYATTSAQRVEHHYEESYLEEPAVSRPKIA